MIILQKKKAPRYVRNEGITSYLFASALTSGAQYLTTSLVEIKPGGKQRMHSHAPEQVYYMLEGTGIMTVGTETGSIVPGDCVFIPSGMAHGLMNDGKMTLKYFSAAAPAFEREQLKKFWPLESEEVEQ